ncbi:MAG TPA: type II and III secretion system protein family protein [Rhizomicrobium sp.]|nr:type II and III secretion system protein family protein [Rhizomicrobium sp.]
MTKLVSKLRLAGAITALSWAVMASAPALAVPQLPHPAAMVDESSARVIRMAAHAGQPENQHITLGLNKAVVVELDTDAKDVLVSSPDIVDAVVKTPRRIFLMATKTGQTNAFFFDEAGHQISSLDIRVERDVSDLAHMMKDTLPNSAIKVSSINDNVVLSGSVDSPVESTRAADLAASFAGDPKKVVNLLSVVGGQQVMLKVRISEMQRQIAKQLGVNMAGIGIIGGSTPLALSTDNQFGLVGRALADLSGGQIGQACTSPAAVIAGGCNNVQGTFQAIEQVGLLHTLAEPNLVAVSGETAKFLAGGEFPVPAGRDQQGNISIQFKQFGVGLSFTPVVLSSGRISLQLSTEVSELTNTGAFTLQGGTVTTSNGTVQTGGVTIPALDVRRADTTVELPSGGSFAIAGLMQHTTKQQINAFPGLKDLPVLGALFRSRDFQNDETELVVLVTAYLVGPTSEAALATPSDGFVTPGDPETILLGRLNTVYKKGADKPLTPQAAAPVGFVVR